MGHDNEYFRRRAAEARSAAFLKDGGEHAEVAGHLALAYSALARRRNAVRATDAIEGVDPVAASVADEQPLMLREQGSEPTATPAA